MSIWKRIKQSWNKYLERMAQSNKEMFGNERPDCCTINRPRANTKR
jgi:hypothetical protein